MTERGHRVVAFAGSVVGIEWSGRHAGDIDRFLFGEQAHVDDRLPESIFRLGSHDEADPLVTLFHGRDCLYRGGSIGTAAHLLVQGTLDSLIRNVASGLVVHGAILGRGDRGVLLPGPSGSGKTMLSAWLATQGLAPLSDEACYLPENDAKAQSFLRPFCFKGEWAEALGLRQPEAGVLQADSVSLVPTQLLNPTCGAAAVVPRLIVFPRFAAGADFEMVPLTPARAAIRLLESVPNARNLSDLGANRLHTLVRSVEAYSLTYGSCSQLSPLLERIAELN